MEHFGLFLMILEYFGIFFDDFWQVRIILEYFALFRNISVQVVPFLTIIDYVTEFQTLLDHFR